MEEAEDVVAPALQPDISTTESQQEKQQQQLQHHHMCTDLLVSEIIADLDLGVDLNLLTRWRLLI